MDRCIQSINTVFIIVAYPNAHGFPSFFQIRIRIRRPLRSLYCLQLKVLLRLYYSYNFSICSFLVGIEKNRFSVLQVLLTFNSYTLKVGPDPHENDRDPTQNWSVFRLHIPHCHLWTRTHSTALEKLKCSRTLENKYIYCTVRTKRAFPLVCLLYLYYAGCRIKKFFCYILAHPAALTGIVDPNSLNMDPDLEA